MKKLLPLFLCVCLLAGTLSGCGGKRDLMQGVTPAVVSDIAAPADGAGVASGLSLRLLRQEMEDGENVLLSPLSILCALSMTANGARGETLAQMEQVLGLPVESLNAYLLACRKTLPDEKKCQVSLANSIWFRDDGSLTVEKDFLQTNAAWYDADLYQLPFNSAACKAINDWVRKKTGGMIPEILQEISPDAAMYLINALSFEAEWQTIYQEASIRDGVFTTEDGQQQTVPMMYSKEYRYLETGTATGFLKSYAGGNCAFAALLPKEGISLADFVDSLTGEQLHDLLASPESVEVWAGIPKFESTYETNLCDTLEALGMTDAFDGQLADFSGIGSSTEGNLTISQVLHKARIAVDEKGTKAGAATAVVEEPAEAPSDPKEVLLNRPFLYLLIDCREQFPVFIGTITTLE
ncbi:serpin family protein [Oscillibacter valericigenes]|uniref:serpin family protein n=1 Tax=Oscillibacter valericigenes TaxID=351091 RepID=UPI001F239C0B|nr:serpin family protein [Oscillibacter valericigenes]MCF2664610.1 serpin family protein [Oscillibacter valericigenes]